MSNDEQLEKTAHLDYLNKLATFYRDKDTADGWLQRFSNNQLIGALSSYGQHYDQLKRLIQHTCVKCSSSLDSISGVIMTKKRVLRHHINRSGRTVIKSYFVSLAKHDKSSRFYVKRCGYCSFMNAYKMKKKIKPTTTVDIETQNENKTINSNTTNGRNANGRNGAGAVNETAKKLHQVLNFKNKPVKKPLEEISAKNKNKNKSNLMSFLNQL